MPSGAQVLQAKQLFDQLDTSQMTPEELQQHAALKQQLDSQPAVQVAARRASPPAARFGDPRAKPLTALEEAAPYAAHPLDTAKSFISALNPLPALRHPVDAFTSDMAARGAAMDRLRSRGMKLLTDDPASAESGEDVRNMFEYAVPGFGPAMAQAGRQMESGSGVERAKGFGSAVALTSGPKIVGNIAGSAARVGGPAYTRLTARLPERMIGSIAGSESRAGARAVMARRIPATGDPGNLPVENFAKNVAAATNDAGADVSRVIDTHTAANKGAAVDVADALQRPYEKRIAEVSKFARGEQTADSQVAALTDQAEARQRAAAQYAGLADWQPGDPIPMTPSQIHKFTRDWRASVKGGFDRMEPTEQAAIMNLHDTIKATVPDAAPAMQDYHDLLRYNENLQAYANPEGGAVQAGTLVPELTSTLRGAARRKIAGGAGWKVPVSYWLNEHAPAGYRYTGTFNPSRLPTGSAEGLAGGSQAAPAAPAAPAQRTMFDGTPVPGDVAPRITPGTGSTVIPPQLPRRGPADYINPSAPSYPLSGRLRAPGGGEVVASTADLATEPQPATPRAPKVARSSKAALKIDPFSVSRVPPAASPVPLKPRAPLALPPASEAPSAAPGGEAAQPTAPKRFDPQQVIERNRQRSAAATAESGRLAGQRETEMPVRRSAIVQQTLRPRKPGEPLSAAAEEPKAASQPAPGTRAPGVSPRARTGELQIVGRATPERVAVLRDAWSWVEQRFPRASKLVDKVEIAPAEAFDAAGDANAMTEPGVRGIAVSDTMLDQMVRDGDSAKLREILAHELTHRSQDELGLYKGAVAEGRRPNELETSAYRRQSQTRYEQEGRITAPPRVRHLMKAPEAASGSAVVPSSSPASRLPSQMSVQELKDLLPQIRQQASAASGDAAKKLNMRADIVAGELKRRLAAGGQPTANPLESLGSKPLAGKPQAAKPATAPLSPGDTVRTKAGTGTVTHTVQREDGSTVHFVDGVKTESGRTVIHKTSGMTRRAPSGGGGGGGGKGGGKSGSGGVPDAMIEAERKRATAETYDKHVSVFDALDTMPGERYRIDEMFDRTSDAESQASGKAVYDGFAQYRKLLRQKYGDTVRLIRYEAPNHPRLPNKTVLHFNDPVNPQFDGTASKEYTRVVERDVPIDDIIGSPKPGELLVLNRESGVLADPMKKKGK